MAIPVKQEPAKHYGGTMRKRDLIESSAKNSKIARESAAIQNEFGNRIANSFSARLVLAVRQAGGHAVISERSGIKSRTLSNLLSGQDPKLTQLVALAEATGTRMEWLATGRGPMRPGEDPALSYIDFENLAAGLEIAEELQPEAPPEARISAALRAADRIRKKQAAGEASPIDTQLLGTCLGMIETLFGRDRPVIRRLRPAIGAYEVMISDPPGPDEAKPASEADKSD